MKCKIYFYILYKQHLKYKHLESGKIVYFDTNSYRDLVFEKKLEEIILEINEIKELERRKNIYASATSTVAIELLGNLVDESAMYNYKDCLNSLIVMGKHCLDHKNDTFRMTPPPFGHISKSLFGLVPSKFEEDLQNLAGLLSSFGKDSQNAIINYKAQGTFNHAKEYLQTGEFNFIENITPLLENAQILMQDRHPASTKKQQRDKLLQYLKSEEFGEQFAIAQVLTVGQVLNVQLPQGEIIARAKFLNKTFPVSVGFFKFICHRIADRSIDLQSKLSKQKRWNWIWDYQVSFVCANQKIDGRDVILVTADDEMTEMLEELGFGNKIYNFERYKEYLLS
jgi:hypothetical protein